MSTRWDRRSALDQRRIQNTQLKQSVLQSAVGYVPFVRARLATAGKDARLFKGLEELPSLATASRRDVFDPIRNPEGSEALLLAGTDEGVKRFSDRTTLRRIAAARLLGGEADAQVVMEAATRPIHMHLVDGPGGKIKVGYTRDDLDLLARAGSRMAQVVGIGREDLVVNLVPAGPSLDHHGVVYAAHGIGATAYHIGREGREARGLATAIELGATAVFMPADICAEALEDLVASGRRFNSLRRLILVGGTLPEDERARIAESLASLEANDAMVAGAYGVAEGRVLWGSCPVPPDHLEGFGFHTFPDADVVEVVDPQTGGIVADERAGELVVTPLGFRGGGAPRWRSGDLVTGGVTRQTCPNCDRTVPRVGPGVARGAWQELIQVAGKRRWVDLSLVAEAAAERAADWVVEAIFDSRSAGLYVHVGGVSDPAPVIELYQDLERIGMPPTQVISATAQDLLDRAAASQEPWPRLLRHSAA